MNNAISAPWAWFMEENFSRQCAGRHQRAQGGTKGMARGLEVMFYKIAAVPLLNMNSVFSHRAGETPNSLWRGLHREECTGTGPDTEKQLVSKPPWQMVLLSHSSFQVTVMSYKKLWQDYFWVLWRRRKVYIKSGLVSCNITFLCHHACIILYFK